MEIWTIMKRITISTIVLFFLLSLNGCFEDDDTNTNLTPARDLEGTWETSFPINFFIRTDFCSNALEDVATEDRMITWFIENTSENTVLITVNFTSSNFEVINENCNPTGYVPDVSPTFLSGSISSTLLTISEYGNKNNVLGEFTFTTDLLQGTWNDSWCAVFCQQVYTGTNQYKLIRQF